MPNNRSYGNNFPKIRNQLNFSSNNLQGEYENLMQDIQKMKGEFITDHIQLIREEGSLMK